MNEECMMANRYSTALRVVQHVLRTNDPLGLIQQGAPVDEYDDEARRISASLFSCKDTDQLSRKIYAIFLEGYGPHTAGPIEAYVRIADEIWKNAK
jgi:hypothetical protein